MKQEDTKNYDKKKCELQKEWVPSGEEDFLPSSSRLKLLIRNKYLLGF